MKKLNRFLTTVLLLVILLSWIPSVQAAAMELPTGGQYGDLGKRIEEFVSEHEDTTAGMALYWLWIAVVLFSVISLLVKLIRKIVCVCRKRQMAIPRSKWSTLSALMQVLMIVAVLVMAVQAKAYATASSYVWIPAALGAIAVIMAGLAVYGIIMIRKTEASKKRKFFNWATAVMLLITPVNIMYWNLFMWWQI